MLFKREISIFKNSKTIKISNFSIESKSTAFTLKSQRLNAFRLHRKLEILHGSAFLDIRSHSCWIELLGINCLSSEIEPEGDGEER